MRFGDSVCVTLTQLIVPAAPAGGTYFLGQAWPVPGRFRVQTMRLLTTPFTGSPCYLGVCDRNGFVFGNFFNNFPTGNTIYVDMLTPAIAISQVWGDGGQQCQATNAPLDVNSDDSPFSWSVGTIGGLGIAYLSTASIASVSIYIRSVLIEGSS
jgi:hypothetical protein